MSDAYTKTQFSDVLESFLAFCHPADLATKEKLYATLDTGKIELKEYQVRQEDSRFDQVMASNDPEMLEMFLQYYPDSPRRPEVEAKLRSLGEYDKFRAIQAQNTFKAYLTYLNDNPNGAFRDEAEAGIFELVKAGNRLKDYEIYLKRFPNGKYVEEAKAALQQAKNGGAQAEEQSIIEYQTGESYSEPEQPAAVEEEPAVEEEDAVEEQQPAVQQNSAASKKAAAKREAAKKARQKQLEAKKARAAKKKKR
jgi:outer membrane protein assembly factor BamD (BamD/ComL family)